MAKFISTDVIVMKWTWKHESKESKQTYLMHSIVSMSVMLLVLLLSKIPSPQCHYCMCMQCSQNPSQISLAFCNFWYCHGIKRVPNRTSQTKKQKPTLSHWNCSAFILWEANLLHRPQHRQRDSRIISEWFTAVRVMLVIAKEDFSDEVSIDIGDIQLQRYGL